MTVLLGNETELQSRSLTKDRCSFPEFCFAIKKIILYGKHMYVYVVIKQTGFAV